MELDAAVKVWKRDGKFDGGQFYDIAGLIKIISNPAAVRLAAIPRAAFDYLWLLDVPPLPPELLGGWQLVWAGDGSRLFKRVDGAAAAPPPATPRTAAAPAR